jgi:hypothetical protein
VFVVHGHKEEAKRRETARYAGTVALTARLFGAALGYSRMAASGVERSPRLRSQRPQGRLLPGAPYMEPSIASVIALYVGRAVSSVGRAADS